MIDIRPMSLLDIETVVSQEISVFGSTLGFNTLYMEITSNPFAHYFVMTDDDRIIGYVGTWVSDENGQIINFYVIPSYRGKHLGEKLLDFALTNLEKLGAKVISLEVRVSNTRAQALYKKKGFELAITRTQYYENHEDAYLLVKYL